MADVSTWEDFVDKYTDSTTDTINITSDLVVPARGIETTIDAGSNKTINGNDHFIYNIAGTAGHLIGSNGGGSAKTVNWGNVQFQNIVGNSVFWDASGSGSSQDVYFNNCVFQGQGQYLFDTGGNLMHLNSCAVTWTYQGSAGVFQKADCSFCWIWLKDCVVLSSPNAIMFDNLYNCYIKGTINGGTGITTLDKLATNTSNSVINFSTDLTLTKVASATTATTVINSTKIPNYTATETNVVKVTDAEMKNAAKLAEVGFPIVVL